MHNQLNAYMCDRQDHGWEPRGRGRPRGTRAQDVEPNQDFGNNGNQWA